MVEEVKTDRMSTRRALKREAILDAAAAQLAESGLAATTLDRVGERVGLSKGALYYYVDSRDALMALLLDRLLAGIRTEADAAVAADAGPLTRLRAFCRAGLLNEITVDASRSYFDTCTDDHPHFFWEDTQVLSDAPVEQLDILRLPDAPKGCEISRVDVVIRLRRTR